MDVTDRRSQAAPPPPKLIRLADQERRPLSRRARLGATVLSVAGHLSVLLVALLLHRDAPRPAEEAPAVSASLVADPRPSEAAPSEAAPQPAPAQAPPKKSFIRKAKLPPPEDEEELEADEKPVPVLTDAQLANAATAESGGGGTGSAGGGGGCNMAGWLQAKLRSDSHVQSAVAASGARGRAMMVWNGDWVRSQGQDGKGLAALREAILWEVAFAPEACRAKPVHGLVLLSLADGPGAARIVVGQDVWHWSDLLMVRAERP